ncbi:MAG: flavin-dependent oxidoreductase [Rhodospirillaceae bacterium]|nr:flavin-dependent oxidoreductase [Rhodospirillaceae bacterium]MBT6139790.1 flavin-dependent oxidoreductase [Rhodospirillaceae bacterium]
MRILIVGGGIAGLTLGLLLERKGFKPHLFEVSPSIEPLGLGVNLLPHCTKVLQEAGMLEELARLAVKTDTAAFYNRFGQFIYSEPLGLAAGYELPQLSTHRADLHLSLVKAFRDRVGADYLHLGHRAVGFEQDAAGVRAKFVDATSGASLPDHEGDVMIAADGIHSAIRKLLHPGEGAPKYSGVNMWRGAAVLPPYLSGATMVRAGWLSTGKMVIYPIRDNVDGKGNQLINWVAELETERQPNRDWNEPGRIEDFIPAFEEMIFDWLDIPAMMRGTERIYEFPMVDQDPLAHWTDGRVTLMGDAAHPMYPRGSNGAGQAILDTKCLADRLAEFKDPRDALRAYEEERRPATEQVVLTNRTNPPDYILKIVYDRTGDKPFDKLEDVVSQEELAAVTANYKKVAGYDKKQLR